MDSAIDTAARALAAGDPLAALDRVALRDDAPGLALRGIAMAQLGELSRARALLLDAAREFGDAEPLSRARCVTARVEVALALRELGHDDAALAEAIEVLERHGDRINALHARLLELRRWLLLGRLDEAEAGYAALSLEGAPARLCAVAWLVEADVAMRKICANRAIRALDAAQRAARAAGVPALWAEIERARQRLGQPAARLHRGGQARGLRLDEVEEVLASDAIIVDACRRRVLRGAQRCSLARRPVLFGLVLALARAWPGDVAREQLVVDVFEARSVNDSLRARLRVEIGRLRRELGELAAIDATDGGFSLRPRGAAEVVVLTPPIDGEHAAVLALLSDGARWSTSALALALGVSARTVQRALAALEAAGSVRSSGRARALRWVASPASGTSTALLLPLVGPGG
ncbi:MAG: HTH domain-containing protein [Myxococcales bacterium]|nr:HTH domain-containing protein [Myxococcales bacterium]